jgi:hypothetical protein
MVAIRYEKAKYKFAYTMHAYTRGFRRRARRACRSSSIHFQPSGSYMYTYYDVKNEKECAAGVRVYGVSSCATGSRSVRERPNLPPKLALCIQQPA